MTESKYSKFTLIPINEEEVAKFKTFRNEDVFHMFKIICILAFCEFCFLILALLYSVATGTEFELNAIKLLYQLTAMLSVWFAEVLGRRFKKHHDSMIALSFLAISILCAWATDVMVDYEDAGSV